MSDDLKYLSKAKSFIEIQKIPLDFINKKISHYVLPNAEGCQALEHITNGLDIGTIDLIGGSSGVGKTTVALSFAGIQSRLGKRVLYISTEMDEYDVARILQYTDRKDYLNVDFMPLSMVSLQDTTNALKEAINANYDVIYFDYINSATLVDTEHKTPISQDQVSSVMLQEIRSQLKTTVYKPHITFFTQLTRNAYNQIPDSTVVQGSSSTCNKVDFAANMIKPNNNIKALFQDLNPNVVMYIYKNRWGSESDCLIGLQVDHYSIKTSSVGIKYDLDWKSLLNFKK